MSTSNRIFAFHLLNDKSGSPKVLSQVLKIWVNQSLNVNVYTSQHKDGFLSNIEGVCYHNGWYIFKSNPWLRLLYYSFNQCYLFFKMFFKINKSDIIYINTVLPFAAAIIGKLKGCRVIYHVHESTVNPAILKWFLFKMVKLCASDIINVSHFVGQSHGIKKVPNHLVYNAIDDGFLSNMLPKNKKKKLPTNLLMVCSLKGYKGVIEFVQLASDFSLCSFCLVLNASKVDIDVFFEGIQLPSNIEIVPSQSNLHPYYQWADVVLNLSKPNAWIETFGLTILEGMAYGIPAIVPNVGGILEVIEEGKTGFSVDSRNREKLNEIVHYILANKGVYQTCSDNALLRFRLFKEDYMQHKIMEIIN